MTGQRCELHEARKVGDPVRCPSLAVTFAMGRHWCAKHRPTGSTSCSHSLAPSGSCAFCGAPNAEAKP